MQRLDYQAQISTVQAMAAVIAVVLGIGFLATGGIGQGVLCVLLGVGHLGWVWEREHRT